MKRWIVGLLMVIVAGSCYAWDAPVQLLPDSIHVYEIPQQTPQEQSSVFMLARIGDSSAVVRFSNCRLDEYQITLSKISIPILAVESEGRVISHICKRLVS